MGLFDVLFGRKKKAGTAVSEPVAQSVNTKSAPPRTSRKGVVTSSKVIVEAKTVDELRSSYIALDFETTGLSPQTDRIVEIGAVRFEHGEPVARLSMLINPGFHMPPSASAVNHITDAMLRGKPKEREATQDIVRFLGESLEGKTLLVAHNAQFDISFLSELLSRQGLDATIRYADTLSMSRHLLKGMPNYKQPTLARHFRISNPQEHRAEADAETCGLIMGRLLDLADAEVEQERKLIEKSRPSDEEYEVCAFIQDCITKAGGNPEEIGFYRNSSGYVDVICTYKLARFKFARKGRYMVLERSCLPKGYPYTEPCTMTEGGTEYVRLYFESPYDLEPLRRYFYDRYREAKRQIAELSVYGIYPDPSDPGSIARNNALSQARVTELLAAAKERPRIGDTSPALSSSAQGDAHVDRAEVEIAPRYARAPLNKVRNRGNRARAFNEGFPLWERGDDERRHGSVEASIELFDRARMAGYSEPALYESYALAFRKLRAYDDEIAILDEAIERLANHGKLEARRDKAMQLLVKERDKEMAKAERAAAKAAAGRETSHTDSQNVVHQKEATQEPQGVPKNAKATTAAGGRPIVRLDDSLTVLETYQSVAEASRSIGISAKSLRDAARGVQKHAGGYVWRYADELES